MTERLSSNQIVESFPATRRLAEELASFEAQQHPNPETIRATANVLKTYFKDAMEKALTNPDSIKAGVHLVLKVTAEVLGSGYRRDRQLDHIAHGKIGEHIADDSLQQAVKYAVDAQKQVADADKRPFSDSLSEPKSVLWQFEDNKHQTSDASIREMATIAILHVTQSDIMDRPEALHDLAKMGVSMTSALGYMAGVFAPHPNDPIGNAPWSNPAECMQLLSEGLEATLL